jgi:aspartyl protease family protein
MLCRFRVAAFMLLIAPAALAGSIYKCKGENGRLQYQETPCAHNEQAVSSWKPSAAPDGKGMLVIGQGLGGNYFVNGSVNDIPSNFAVDTGASTVSIPIDLAKSAGLRCQSMGSVETANGTERICYTTIEKLVFGQFTLQYVSAAITPGLDQPLLGMNVLKRFHIEQVGNKMHLSRLY